MNMQMVSAHMVMPTNSDWNHRPNSGPSSISISRALHIGHNGADVDAGIRTDNAGCLSDNALGHVEHAHDDVPGIGDDQDGGRRF